MIAIGLGTAWLLAALRQVEHENVAIDASPDGKSVAFSSADGDLFLLHLETREVRRLTNTAAIESSPVFSPDGQSLVYSAGDERSGGRSLFVQTIDGKSVQRLTRSSKVSDALPRYSPDGSQIVFARAHLRRPYSLGGWTWDDWDVYVMDASGEDLRRLTHNEHYGINTVLFSRDGQSVIYSAELVESGGPVTIFALPADGSGSPTQVAANPNSSGEHYAWACEPALSPDGGQMVFVSDRSRPYHYDLLLMDLPHGVPRSLGATQISRYNQNPVFTADGNSILFLAGTEWNAGSRPIFSLWSLDIESGDAEQIADTGLFTNPMNWRAEP